MPNDISQPGSWHRERRLSLQACCLQTSWQLYSYDDSQAPYVGNNNCLFQRQANGIHLYSLQLGLNLYQVVILRHKPLGQTPRSTISTKRSDQQPSSYKKLQNHSSLKIWKKMNAFNRPLKLSSTSLQKKSKWENWNIRNDQIEIGKELKEENPKWIERFVKNEMDSEFELLRHAYSSLWSQVACFFVFLWKSYSSFGLVKENPLALPSYPDDRVKMCDFNDITSFICLHLIYMLVLFEYN